MRVHHTVLLSAEHPMFKILIPSLSSITSTASADLSTRSPTFADFGQSIRLH